jgi:hypothetical protein
MRIIAMILPVIFVILFSLPVFSQSTEPSAHPLLDKYYPQGKAPDTNKTVSTQIKPVNTYQPQASGKTVSPVTAPPTVTAVAPETPAPGDTTTRSVTIIPAAGTPATINNTSPLSNPTTVTAVVPAARKVQPQAGTGPPTLDTRLGSSTPQYDTWEKNKNGAGSVTTSPK